MNPLNLNIEALIERSETPKEFLFDLADLVFFDACTCEPDPDASAIEEYLSLTKA